MKKFISIFLICFILQGCSLVKAVTAPFKPTTTTLPQQTDKSKNKDVCKGEAKFNEQGDMIYCSKGFYSYAENFSEKERKLTIKERVVQFVNKFFGWTIVIAIILVIVAPGTLFSILGWIIAKQKKVLTQIIQGIQDARKKNVELNTALASATDADVKQEIIKIKTDENIK